MKTYILNTINRLKQKSETLDAQAILTGKKWLVFNDSGEQGVYKFFANGKVLISVNGVGNGNTTSTLTNFREEHKESMTWEYTGPNVDKDLEYLKENFEWKTYKK